MEYNEHDDKAVRAGNVPMMCVCDSSVEAEINLLDWERVGTRRGGSVCTVCTLCFRPHRLRRFADFSDFFLRRRQSMITSLDLLLSVDLKSYLIFHLFS